MSTGATSIAVFRPPRRWDAADGEQGFASGENMCLEVGAGSAFATREALEVYPLLYLLQTQPWDLWRALPSTVIMSALMRTAFKASYGSAAHAVVVQSPVAGASADVAPQALTADFFLGCSALAPMLSDSSIGVLCETIIKANRCTAAELSLLQRLVQQLDAHLDDEAGRDAFVVAATACLPCPFPLVRILALADFVQHEEGISRCMVLLMSALRGVDCAQMKKWWADVGDGDEGTGP